MSALGTDVMAVACILSGAGVGGVTTAALMHRDAGPAEVACAGAAIHTSPRVVVSMDNGKGTVVVAPRVRIHASHNCGTFVVDMDSDVQVNMREMRARMDEARARMEEARSRMEEARNRVETARAADGSALNADIQKRVEKQLQEQMERLDREMAKLDAGTGR